MSEDKFEATKLKKERLRDSLKKAKSHASDVLSFTQSYEDLENHFESIKADLAKRSLELEAKEKYLKERSQALERKAQSVNKRAREIDSADSFKREVEEKQKLLDSLEEELQSKEKKLSTADRLLQRKKIALKNTIEEVDALRKNEVDDSKENKCKKISKKQQQCQEKKYNETLKTEETKLRDVTRDVKLKEGELQRVKAELRRRKAESEMEKRRMDKLREGIGKAEKKVQDLAGPNERKNIAVEAKEREVDLGEKRLGKGRGNREISGNEGRNLNKKSLKKGRGNTGIQATEGSGLRLGREEPRERKSKQRD